MGILSAPDNHLTACRHCRMISSRIGSVCGARRCPGISIGIVSAASVQTVKPVKSSPNYHFAAYPNSSMRKAATWSIGGTCGSPTVCSRIVSATTIKKITEATAPHDHLSTSPDCRVVGTRGRCVDRAVCRPGISARIISSSTAKSEVGIHFTPPDDHFAAGPNGCVMLSTIGRAGGGCPGIVTASAA